MILHFGVRTTEPTRVAYRALKPGEDETRVTSELLSKITGLYDRYQTSYDHSMIVYYDPPEKVDGRREILVPLPLKLDSVESKVFPSIRAAFIVFEGAETSVEVYYERLKELIELRGLERDEGIHSIEIMYVPEDLDNTDYTLEIMFPVKR